MLGQEGIALSIVGIAFSVGTIQVFRSHLGASAALWILKRAHFPGSSKFAMWLRGPAKSGCDSCENNPS